MPLFFLIFGRVSTVHLLLEAGWLGQCKKARPMLLWSLGVPLPCEAGRANAMWSCEIMQKMWSVWWLWIDRGTFLVFEGFFMLDQLPKSWCFP
jgi:hypothetical protein